MSVVKAIVGSLVLLVSLALAAFAGYTYAQQGQDDECEEAVRAYDEYTTALSGALTALRANDLAAMEEAVGDMEQVRGTSELSVLRDRCLEAS